MSSKVSSVRARRQRGRWWTRSEGEKSGGRRARSVERRRGGHREIYDLPEIRSERPRFRRTSTDRKHRPRPRGTDSSPPLEDVSSVRHRAGRDPERRPLLLDHADLQQRCRIISLLRFFSAASRVAAGSRARAASQRAVT